MKQFKMKEVCSYCIERGLIVRTYRIIGDDIKCVKCGKIVGEIDIDYSKLEDEPDAGYLR